MNRLIFLIAVLFLTACSAAKKAGPDVPKVTRIQIVTDSGTIVAKLFDDTPLHKKNFVHLVKEHFYDGLLFHRVIDHFMIQGGDPTSRNARPGELLGDGGTKKTITAEISPDHFHQRGALAAAREPDEVNPARASSFSQFFIIEGQKFTDEQLDQIEKRFSIKIPEEHRVVYRTVGGSPFLDGKYTIFGQVESGFDVIEKIASMKVDNNNRPLKDIAMKVTILK